MPVRIRKSYIEEKIGPCLATTEGEPRGRRLPVHHLDHLFFIKGAFYGAKYAHGDEASTPVEIESYTTGRTFIVRLGDIYEVNENPSAWATNEEYRQGDGAHVCPNQKCKSTDTQGTGVDIEGKTAKQMMYCNDCGASWTAIFTLCGYIAE